MATGGTATGGIATGGACAAVDVLPAPGTACNGVGWSYCDLAGNRCVCAGTWYCSSACAPDRAPTPNTPCSGGLACDYPAQGITCACVDSLWVCAGGPTCPAAVPATGDGCAGLANLVCDYPGSVHLGCACLADSTATRWVCMTLAACPEGPPPYSATCDGPSLCTYGSLRCGCLQAGTLWTCV
jgi:hypothetical protein